MNTTLVTVLTSAAIGALVSSLVTLTGQYFERKARRRELLLKEALELAKHRTDFAFEVAKASNQAAGFVDPIFNVETYYQWLRTLMETGKLPTDATSKKFSMR